MRNIILFTFLTLIVAAGIIYFTQGKQKAQIPSQSPTSISTPFPKAVDFTASFEISTLGTKRIFTDSKYHNLSKDVYISLPDPSIVHVKKSGVTWADFFATLPMKLTKDCLTTGTKQTFCSDESRTLKFFINGKEENDALDQEIGSGSTLRVIYD